MIKTILATIISTLLKVLLFGVTLALFCVSAFAQKPDSWYKVTKASRLLTNDSKLANEYIVLGQDDSELGQSNSIFHNKLSKKFGDNFIDWVDEELESEDAPCAVFKTVMFGLGYMGYLDWKSIYSVEELTFAFNNVLKTHNVNTLTGSEKSKLTTIVEGSGEDAEHNARENIRSLENAIESRGYKVLWFDESGDSYAFFIVTPKTYNFLISRTLDSEHKFIPFTF